MRRPTTARAARFVLCLATASALAVTLPAPADDSAGRAVAVTFDDLPATASVGGDCDRRALVELNRRLLRKLEAASVPATGLVTAGRVCDALRPALLPEILDLWLAAGHELGNHTFSHPDLNSTPLEAYQRDVLRGEEIVREAVEARGRKLRFFRHPFLHTGPDAETKRAFDRFLAERGYRLAPVTIDNQEWIFAAVYVRAKERGDRETMARVASAYVPFMAEVFAFFEARSREVVGYEPPQILLLHVNELNADHFDALAAMIRDRGYRFIHLEDALADPAYRLPDGYVGRRGPSWIHRGAAAKGLEPKVEPREPAWLRELWQTRGREE